MKARWEEKGKSVVEKVFRQELELNSHDFIIKKADEFDEYLSIFTKDGRFLTSLSRGNIEAYLNATTEAALDVAVEGIVKELEESI